MTAIILAGGKNTRMGMKKAFIHIKGNPIIDRAITILKDFFSEVIIIANTPEDFSNYDLEVFPDLIPEKGSLGGLYTGLVAMRSERGFVLACDMPYINKSLIRYMMDQQGYDIVVPKIDNLYEPLFAFYSKKCAAFARKNIAQHNLKITDIYANLNVKEIHEDVIKKYDKDMRSFININTPEDLKKINTIY